MTRDQNLLPPSPTPPSRLTAATELPLLRGPPSKSGCLVPWASVAFVLKYETNPSVWSCSSGMHRCVRDDIAASRDLA